MRCTKIKADGKRCQAAALEGEELCLFHSKSEAADKARRKGRAKRISREELLKNLSREFRELDNIKDLTSRSRLKATYANLIHELLNELEKLDELERRIEEMGQNG